MAEPQIGEVRDASRFIHGRLYHALYDSALDEARRVVLELVPRGCRVIDIACGTGELCRALAAENGCAVVGVDLSQRMLEFAQKRHGGRKVSFKHADATSLSGMESDGFDYATMLFLIHEVPPAEQAMALAEALRVAPRVVVVDSRVPLPRNLHAAALHVAEAIGGRAHYASFAGYLARNGIDGALSQLAVRPEVVHRRTFWHGCRDAVVLARAGLAGDCAQAT